jgi:MATE family multidrug resistance protein
MNLAMLLAYVCVDERWWATGALDEWRSAKAAITRDMVARVAHLSTQGVIMVFGEAFSFEVTVVLAAQLGEVSLGAHMVMLNICTMTFMMGPMSFGTAASIRVGNLLGMRDPRGAKRSAWLITSMSLTFMAGCSFMILFAIKPIARLYTGNDPEITATLIKIAPYAAAFQIFDASLGCCNGILRACGKQAFIAKSNLASLWLCGLTSGALITFVGDEGVKGLWVGLMIGVGMAGSFLASVVYRLDWQHESFLATRAATNVFRGGAAL